MVFQNLEQPSGTSNIEGIRYVKVELVKANIYYSLMVQLGHKLIKIPIKTTGTVSVTAGSATVTGSGTSFTTEFSVGDDIKINNEIFNVLSITDNVN